MSKPIHSRRAPKTEASNDHAPVAAMTRPGAAARRPAAEDQRVSMLELRDRLKCSRMMIQNWAARLGIEPRLHRDHSRQNHLVSTVTVAEGDRITDATLSRRIDRSASNLSSQRLLLPGHFYIVQLEPKLEPTRIKVGFTVDLQQRLRTHRCAAPYADYLKYWRCRAAWERAAIDSITLGCRQVHHEVFVAKNLKSLLTAASKFFAVMPPLAEP
jgi:hypothetical protein